MPLGKFSVPGRPTDLDMVGQESTEHVVGTGCLDIFSLASFSLSLGDGPI